MNEPTPPEMDKARARAERSRYYLGWLGRIWGGRRNAPVNIAGLAILVSFGLLAYIVIFNNGVPEASENLVTGCISIIVLGLGYLFGKGIGTERERDP